jgi:acyl-CoA hydrolase
MLSDRLLDFLERRRGDARVVVGEVAGSLEMYRRAAADPRVSFRPTTVVHHLPYLAGLRRFVAINSAIEVDLGGQVNSETLQGVQLSGVGGSLDFMEGARYSEGGVSIIALRSMAKGRSRIVPQLSVGSAVTVPRFAVDVVVSEHGSARLAGLDLSERAEALIGIAAPESRESLRAALRNGFERGR